MPTFDSDIWIGTYSNGVYIAAFSTHTGELGQPLVAAKVVRPSFLAAHPGGRFLYAVSEQAAGEVSAWAIGEDGRELSLLNRAPSCGAGPCHITVDRSGNFLVVANYGGGSVAALRIREDGAFGDVTSHHQFSGAGVRMPRQARPHPHGAFFSPDNRFVIVPDLGCDQLRSFRLNAGSGSLEAAGPASVSLPAGSGPRHFVFHPSGSWAYALCELDSAVATFEFDAARGALRYRGLAPVLPPGFHGENIAAGIAMDVEGKYLYCSNRGADTIVVLRIDPNGRLHAVQHSQAQGRTPRHFTIDPSGKWLLVANQDSGHLAVFGRDPLLGTLEAAGRPQAVPDPACVVFTPRFP